MFNENFYPTPAHVVKLMVAKSNILHRLPYDSTLRVLEPSAGKGNICDFIVNTLDDKHQSKRTFLKNRFYTIEPNFELQGILRDKNYKLVDADFLSYDPDMTFDVIIMNPPFDNAVKHLLKAFEISNGAEIVALYPTESLNNLYSKERRLAYDLINQKKGVIEHLGNCFSDAERSTNVEVSLIYIPASKKESRFDFSTLQTEANSGYTFNDLNNTQLEQADVIDSLVNRFDATKKALADFIEIKQKLSFLLKGVVYGGFDSFLQQVSRDTVSSDNDSFFENLVNGLKAECWKTILRKTKLDNVITSNVSKNFEDFTNKQTNLAFNRSNIEALHDMLMLNRGQIMMSSLLDAFDYMTAYHEENRVYFEGWKTNQSWKVTKKVILPSIFSKDDSYLHFSYYSSNERISDIEKVLCFLSNKKYEDTKHNCIYAHVTKTQKVPVTGKDKFGKEYSYLKDQSVRLEHGVWHDSEFFRFKGFKKGTLHLEFKDQKLYEKFNLVACQGKKWLPPSSEKPTPNTTSVALVPVN